MKNTLRIFTASFGMFLILNGIFMLIFASFTAGIFLTTVLGLCFFLPSVYISLFRKLMEYTFFKFFVCMVVFGVSVAFITSAFLYIYGNSDNVTYKEDYLVVLGCGLNGSSPTAPLKARLDTAIEYIQKNPECTIIVSGGQGNGETISEAEAMKKYLVLKGIEEDRILEENKSTSTTENFKFSNKVSHSGLSEKNAAFITNDFHIYRAASLAKLQGFSLTHLAAPTVWYNIFPCYLREMLAIIKMVVFKS